MSENRIAKFFEPKGCCCHKRAKRTRRRVYGEILALEAIVGTNVIEFNVPTLEDFLQDADPPIRIWWQQAFDELSTDKPLGEQTATALRNMADALNVVAEKIERAECGGAE
jgi:hypothetical protein